MYPTVSLNTSKTTLINNPHISQSLKKNKAKRLSNICAFAIPIALAILMLVILKELWLPSNLAMVLFGVFFVLSSAGLGIGFHRHYTHHAFKTSMTGKIMLGVMGTWSMQGGIIAWVADHRRHHRFADQQFDPHSPWADDLGPIHNRFAGWFHAHVGWKFTGAVSDESRYVPDLLKDPVAVFLTRYYWPIALSGLALPSIVGYAYGGWEEAANCLLWAGCIRAILLQQFEGVANSITHMFGSKLEGSKDESRDNMLMTIVLLGEGLHSYHHQNATVAVNQPSKLDFFGHMILLCEHLGWFWDLRKAKSAPTTSQPELLQVTGLLGAGRM